MKKNIIRKIIFICFFRLIIDKGNNIIKNSKIQILNRLLLSNPMVVKIENCSDSNLKFYNFNFVFLEILY